MKTLIWALVAVLAAASSALAQPTDGRPEFSGKWYLTVIYDAPRSPASTELAEFFRIDPGMRQLTSMTNWHEWDDADAIVQETNWKKFLGSTRPAILLQGMAQLDGSADVVFFTNGESAKPGRALVNSLREAISAYITHSATPVGQRQRWRPFCPDGQCRPFQQRRQQLQPKVKPQVKVDVKIPPVVEPLIPTVDVVVATPSELKLAEDVDRTRLPILALLAVAGAGLAGLYASQKQSA